jgi:glucoamylase
MAKELGLSCPHCDAIAPHILCFLQAFWSEKDGHILSNSTLFLSLLLSASVLII